MRQWEWLLLEKVETKNEDHYHKWSAFLLCQSSASISKDGRSVPCPRCHPRQLFQRPHLGSLQHKHGLHWTLRNDVAMLQFPIEGGDLQRWKQVTDWTQPRSWSNLLPNETLRNLETNVFCSLRFSAPEKQYHPPNLPFLRSKLFLHMASMISTMTFSIFMKKQGSGWCQCP